MAAPTAGMAIKHGTQPRTLTIENKEITNPHSYRYLVKNQRFATKTNAMCAKFHVDAVSTPFTNSFGGMIDFA